MSRIINIREAKAHLSRILDEVAAGSEVIIAKDGKPMARLAAFTGVRRAKKLGLPKGKIKVPDDFNAPLPQDVMVSFEGR
jgi:prevent-host-death family protein